MPWTTPTLEQTRKLNRDYITARLHSAAMVPNSALRVLSDANAGLCYLNLVYLDWLSRQFLPDTAEAEWLDRQAAIWLPGNGRKLATFALGSGSATGIVGSILPNASQLTGTNNAQYETTEEIVIGNGPTPVNIRAVDPGIAGNQEEGSILTFVGAIAGVDGTVTVVQMTGGVDQENDDDLRQRVLDRIQQPPMGGDASDYEQWAKQVPGVTRAWCAPLEMGIGTVTVRFMMDELRADNDGFPFGEDVETVKAYLDTKRPIAVKDIFVVAPIKQRIDVYIAHLIPDNEAIRAGIEASLKELIFEMATPGQTIFASWKSYAIMSTPNVASFDLADNTDDVMESPGHMAVLGDIVYAVTA